MALGPYCIAGKLDENNEPDGNFAVAINYNNKVYGSSSFAANVGHTIYGVRSTAFGNGN